MSVIFVATIRNPGALREAVMSQTNVDSWNEVGGPGAIEFAKPGTLVISNQESAHMAVLDLLETYRARYAIPSLVIDMPRTLTN